MVNKLKRIYENPVVVGFTRGLGLAVGAAVINYAVMYIQGHPLPLVLQPVVLLALRTLEGGIDSARDGSSPH